MAKFIMDGDLFMVTVENKIYAYGSYRNGVASFSIFGAGIKGKDIECSDVKSTVLNELKQEYLKRYEEIDELLKEE